MTWSRCAQAISQKPDIILLDVMIPVMDSLAVLRKLQGYLPSKHIPVIMLKAKDGIENSESRRIDNLLMAQYMQAGAVDYIEKSATPERLRDYIRQVRFNLTGESQA